jgi:hypothetical protein
MIRSFAGDGLSDMQPAAHGLYRLRHPVSACAFPFNYLVIRNSPYQDCTTPVKTKVFTVEPNICGPSVRELVSCHPSGALNFEVALRFLENLRTCGLYLYIWRLNFQRIYFGLECPLLTWNFFM